MDWITEGWRIFSLSDIHFTVANSNHSKSSDSFILYITRNERISDVVIQTWRCRVVDGYKILFKPTAQLNVCRWHYVYDY